MSKLFKTIVSFSLAIAMISCYILFAMAASFEMSAKTTRIASVGTGSTGCGAMEGLCVTATGSNNRLFVVKINAEENKAMLYMYEDYTEMDNTNKHCGRFVLSGFAGHANGLAVDKSYIYITCWSSKKGQEGQRAQIARISRRTLWGMYIAKSGLDKGTITAQTEGCTILSPVYSNGKAYDRTINAITYYKDGKFIINYPLTSAEKYYTSSNKVLSFTTAQIIDGKFTVSTSENDIFCVDTGFETSTGQDIGYGSSNGFFIAQWLGGARNKIIWIRLNSLSGAKRVYTSSNSKYRHINVNKSSELFVKYELESVSIGSDKHLYANVNTAITEGGNPAYATDAVIKVERTSEVNGKTQFMGIDIDK